MFSRRSFTVTNNTIINKDGNKHVILFNKRITYDFKRNEITNTAAEVLKLLYVMIATKKMEIAFEKLWCKL